MRFCSGFRDGTLVLAVLAKEEGRAIITRTEKKIRIKKKRKKDKEKPISDLRCINA